MWIPCRQRLVLRRMSHDLWRPDPHLAAMFVIFLRLTAPSPPPLDHGPMAVQRSPDGELPPASTKAG